MLITLAHSPDSDDAFMFYALAKNRIHSDSYHFEHILKDIETLNQSAEKEIYDISAISLHVYPFISKHYQILPCGGSVGNNYGPMIISRKNFTQKEFLEKFRGVNNHRIIAIPGEKTTAFLTLKLLLGEFRYQVTPFDQIIPQVLEGKADAGLIIHEGQLNYSEWGLYAIIDLGNWWKKETGLPLPLGANVIRRKLGQKIIYEITDLIRKSIEYGLSKENKEEALKYSMQFARGLNEQDAEKFIQMYVNHHTVQFDLECIEAINLLFQKGKEIGLLPKLERISLP